MLLPLASTTNQVLAQHRVGREAVIVYALIKLCDSLSMLTTPTIVFLGWFLSYDYGTIYVFDLSSTPLSQTIIPIAT